MKAVTRISLAAIVLALCASSATVEFGGGLEALLPKLYPELRAVWAQARAGMKVVMRTVVAAIVLALCATLATAQFGGGGPFGGGGGSGYGNNGYGNGNGNDNSGGDGQRESFQPSHIGLLVSDSTILLTPKVVPRYGIQQEFRCAELSH